MNSVIMTNRNIGDLEYFLNKTNEAFENWMKDSTTNSFKDIRSNFIKSLYKDSELAWGYFCNIKMPIYDNSKCSLFEAERSAIYIMKYLFEYDIEKVEELKYRLMKGDELKNKPIQENNNKNFNSSGSKYLKTMLGLVDGKADVYSVLDTFEVTCPARQHAIKKLLFSGKRGKGDELQDLKEAKDAVERAIQLFNSKNVE